MSSARTLLFDWPARHTLQLVLPFTIVLAAAAHVGVFFLFSIIYPSPKPEMPDPVEVYFPLPGSPDAERLQAILSVSDPAIFAPGRGLGLSASSPGGYQASYDSARIVLAPLPTVAETQVVAPLAKQSAPLQPRTASRWNTATPKSRLAASGPLAGRVPDLPAGTEWRTTSGAILDASRFLVCVRPDGTVAHVFPAGSSGAADLDAAAMEVLLKLTFAPAGDREAWDTVRFSWGTDVQRAVEP